MALHGHATIELTNVETGEVTKVEEDNLVTNGLAKVLQYVPTESVPPITKVLKTTTDSVDGSSGFTRSIRMLTGGVLLFDSKLEEDPDNIIPPAGVRTVGCGATIPYTGTNTMAGSYNESESGIIENGYKHVWDFGTAQANGQIASVCLTTREGGFAGAGTYPYDKKYSFTKDALGTTFPNSNDCLSQRTDSLLVFHDPYDKQHYLSANDDVVLYADYDRGTMYGLADVEEWWYAYSTSFSTTPSKNNKKSFIYKKSLTLSEKRLILKDISIFDENKTVTNGSGSARELRKITVEMPDSLKKVIDNYMTKEGYYKVENSSDEGFLYIFIYKDMASTSNSETLLIDDTFHIWKINMKDFTSTHITLQNRTKKALAVKEDYYDSQKKILYITNNYVLVRATDNYLYLININNSEDTSTILYQGEGNTTYDGTFARIYCICGKIYFDTRDVIDTITKECRKRNLTSGAMNFSEESNMLDATYVQGSNNIILLRYCSAASNTTVQYLACMGLPETLITINNLSTPVTKTSAQSMKITYTLTEE